MTELVLSNRAIVCALCCLFLNASIADATDLRETIMNTSYMRNRAAQGRKSLAPPPVPQIRDKWALLSGVGHFASPEIGQLRYPHRDVIVLREVLKDPELGKFAPDHVASICDSQATKAELEKVITQTWLVRKALPTDLIFLYISGRSIPSVDDVAFMTFDSKPDSAQTGVSLKAVLEELKRRTQCKNILCVLDLTPIPSFKAPDVLPLQKLSAETGTTILSATDFTQNSIESSADGSSLFIHYLSEGLRAGGGTMTLDQIGKYIAENIDADAKALKMAQSAKIAYSPENPDMANIVLGVQSKVAATNAGASLKFGHSLDTLPMKRPDLERALAPTPKKDSATPTSAQNADEDESDGKFAQVNYGPYMAKMKKDIQAKWNPPRKLDQKRVVATFAIMKDGSIINSELLESSGDGEVDQSAMDALKAASPLSPLPDGAPKSIQIKYKFDWSVSAH